MPAEITMAYPITKGTIKKEVIPELRTVASISLKDIKSKFIDTVYKDAVVDVQGEDKGTIKKEVFGLPLAVDTLALYYNNDLLNNAGIAEPSIYWNREFQLAVKSLTKQDAKGQIIQSGVALGGSANIERYSDILSVLMMQNGAEMINDAGQVVFDKIPASLREQKYNPGLEALRFYTDFSNPAKEVYAWNNSLDNSLEMFIQGKLAMFFGYAYHLPTISARAPKLNFSISKLPQIEGNLQRVDFANYWVETVSNKSKYINEAWDFIQFATTNPDQTRLYLAVAKKSTALRSIINEQISDMEVGVFAEQALTAKSWYRGEDFNAAELIIGEMINDMAKAEKKPEEIISLGAKRIEQTIED